MYLWDLVRTLRRRWYVVLPGLLVTLLAAGMAMKVVSPQYQATGSMVLTSPPIVGDGADPNQRTNPYLNFSAPLGATAEIVSSSVNSDQTSTTLKSKGAQGSYLVAVDPNSDAPLITIEATASDPSQALNTMRLVVTAIRGRLQQIQATADAPANQYIHAQAVTTSPTAPAIHGSLIRVLAVVVLVGLLASCGGAVVAEAVSRGRERKARNYRVVAPKAEEFPDPADKPDDDLFVDEHISVDTPHPMPLGEAPALSRSAGASRASTR